MKTRKIAGIIFVIIGIAGFIHAALIFANAKKDASYDFALITYAIIDIIFILGGFKLTRIKKENPIE
jgi:hypothetical protein